MIYRSSHNSIHWLFTDVNTAAISGLIRRPKGLGYEADDAA